MAFNDDEQSAPSSVAKPNNGITGFPLGQVQLTKYSDAEAPLTANNQEVLLELRGVSSASDRAGLDLIAIIDVSGSMNGDKLTKVKAALHFVIRKLTDVDRLCIVTFSNAATRLCPLRFVTEAAQGDLKSLVDALVANGGTNIKAGLETGLSIVAGRRLTAGRAVNIMLMSDGQQNHGEARDVDVSKVPVHTFGFGADHDPKLLGDIATKSLGGTFNYVKDGVNLTAPFSQILGGLLTIIAQDLELTITAQDATEATITKVDAGTYPQKLSPDGSSVTVSFGTLYSAEVRKVIVYLALPDNSTSSPYDATLIDVMFRLAGSPGGSTPDPVVLRRTGSAPDPADAPKKPQVQNELARRSHAELIRAATGMAEGKDLENARDKLVEAQNALEDILDQANPMVDMLRTELQQLLGLMETQELYDKEGRPYAISSLASHDRQRFAARGDAEAVRLFSTPRMDAYLEQAKQFDENPDAPLPTADADVAKEVAANPLAPIAGQLAFYIKSAIQALQAIDKIFTTVAGGNGSS